jgi:hypothetical protein
VNLGEMIIVSRTTRNSGLTYRDRLSLQQEFFFKGNPMIFQKPFVFIKKGHFFMVVLLILHVLD